MGDNHALLTHPHDTKKVRYMRTFFHLQKNYSYLTIEMRFAV